MCICAECDYKITFRCCEMFKVNAEVGMATGAIEVCCKFFAWLIKLCYNILQFTTNNSPQTTKYCLTPTNRGHFKFLLILLTTVTYNSDYTTPHLQSILQNVCYKIDQSLLWTLTNSSQSRTFLPAKLNVCEIT